MDPKPEPGPEPEPEPVLDPASGALGLPAAAPAPRPDPKNLMTLEPAADDGCATTPRTPLPSSPPDDHPSTTRAHRHKASSPHGAPLPMQELELEPEPEPEHDRNFPFGVQTAVDDAKQHEAEPSASQVELGPGPEPEPEPVLDTASSGALGLPPAAPAPRPDPKNLMTLDDGCATTPRTPLPSLPPEDHPSTTRAHRHKASSPHGAPLPMQELQPEPEPEHDRNFPFGVQTAVDDAKQHEAEPSASQVDEQLLEATVQLAKLGRGFMELRGPDTWRQLYFVLDGQHLVYFDGSGGPKEGHIDLANACAWETVDAGSDGALQMTLCAGDGSAWEFRCVHASVATAWQAILSVAAPNLGGRLRTSFVEEVGRLNRMVSVEFVLGQRIQGHDGESDVVEYKDCRGWDASRSGFFENIDEHVVPNVAGFLNSRQGGSLFFGVDDSSCKVVGVAFPRGNAGNKAWDEWTRKAANKLRLCAECRGGAGGDQEYRLFAAAEAGSSMYTFQRHRVEEGNPADYVRASRGEIRVPTKDFELFVVEVRVKAASQWPPQVPQDTPWLVRHDMSGQIMFREYHRKYGCLVQEDDIDLSAACRKCGLEPPAPVVVVDIIAVGQTVWAKFQPSSKTYKQAAVKAVNGNTEPGTQGISPDDKFALQFAGWADVTQDIPRSQIQPRKKAGGGSTKHSKSHHQGPGKSKSHHVKPGKSHGKKHKK